jgi:hypothetical protein
MKQSDKTLVSKDFIDCQLGDAMAPRKKDYPLTYKDLKAMFKESEMKRIRIIAQTEEEARELISWGADFKHSRFKWKLITLLKQNGIKTNECYTG